MAKIFVGNFSFSVDDEKLKTYFARIGNVVSGKVMREGQDGRSRGFGFVEFATAEEAQAAISQLDGSVWDGRVIKVSEDLSHRRGDRDGANSNFHGQGHHGHSHSEGGEEGGYSRSSQPMGYFRAQPLDLGLKKKRKLDPFLEDTKLSIDYKDAKLLSRFISERGRILPRRMTGLTAYHQRQVTRAIKRAQHIGLLSATERPQ